MPNRLQNMELMESLRSGFIAIGLSQYVAYTDQILKGILQVQTQKYVWHFFTSSVLFFSCFFVALSVADVTVPHFSTMQVSSLISFLQQISPLVLHSLHVLSYASYSVLFGIL